MFLARCGHKPDHSFAATSTVTCPACNGKHRAHTYDEHCHLERPKGKEVRKKAESRKLKDSNEDVNKPEVSSVPPKRRLETKTAPVQRQPEHKPMPVDPVRSIAEEPPTAAPSSEPKKQVVVEDDEALPISQKKDPKIKADLPLALRRIREKLDSPVELYKLHLKHCHMSTEQFRKRTPALKIPEDIYAKYDLIVKQCDTCQREKRGPSRSKISGMRNSEILRDLTFIDHAEIPLDNKCKLMFLIIYDGATQLMTSFPCEKKTENATAALLMDYFDLDQLSPKYIVGDQGFSGLELEAFYNRKGIRFIALGPQTPWPNRAEAAVRLFKQQVRLNVDGVRADPLCNPFTF